MKIHELKCIDPYFSYIENGTKSFEIRKNDRDFKVGDLLHLRKYIPPSKVRKFGPVYFEPYEEEIPGSYDKRGKELIAKVTYITDFPDGLKEGYVVLGIKLCQI